MKTLGDVIRSKISSRKKNIVTNIASSKQCSKCSIYTDIKELKFNAQFAMYDYQEVCNKCADKIEESWESLKKEKNKD